MPTCRIVLPGSTHLVHFSDLCGLRNRLAGVSERDLSKTLMITIRSKPLVFVKSITRPMNGIILRRTRYRVDVPVMDIRSNHVMFQLWYTGFPYLDSSRATGCRRSIWPLEYLVMTNVMWMITFPTIANHFLKLKLHVISAG